MLASWRCGAGSRLAHRGSRGLLLAGPTYPTVRLCAGLLQRAWLVSRVGCRGAAAAWAQAEALPAGRRECVAARLGDWLQLAAQRRCRRALLGLGRGSPQRAWALQLQLQRRGGSTPGRVRLLLRAVCGLRLGQSCCEGRQVQLQALWALREPVAR